jgi:hypothetical protein
MLRITRMIRLSRRLPRNCSGATVMEFAIIAMPLLACIAFLIEGAFQLLTGAMLQYGLREATRFGITGLPYPPSMSSSPPASREEAIKQIIITASAGLINPSRLDIKLKAYSSFGDVGMAGKGTDGSAGGAQAVVLYQLSCYQPWLPGLANFAANATHLSGLQHTASAVVQNEKFPPK